MRAHLGQHFMKSRKAIRAMITSLDIRKGDTVIEIGGGEGALTIPLAEMCERKDARLIVIERDERLVQKLGSVEVLKTKGIEIVQGDALKLLTSNNWKWSSGGGFASGGEMGNWKLAGNIPYYLTGKLFRILSEAETPPASAVFTIQAEVADRVAATPGTMSLLAGTVAAWAHPAVLMRLKPTDFDPPPEVSSAILLLTRNDSVLPLPERERYFSMLRILFRQPRKTVWNNLRAAFPDDENSLMKTLTNAGIDPKLRPQHLSLEMLINLASRFQ
ncbi:MAG: rRNA adenine dimethyltransferase family protein [Patescibacteria group bacterium]